MQEESIDSSETQKEENIDGQDNTDKSKGEIKAVTEESIEMTKKEVNHTLMLC